MFAFRAFVIASLLIAASSAHAQGSQHIELGRSGADVYATAACWTPNCFMTSTALGWPNPAPYTTLASLTLPPGHYLLHGKLSAYTNSRLNWGNLECYMGTEEDRPSDWWNFTDYASVAYNGEGQQHVVSMVLAAKIHAPTTMRIGCKLAGYYYDVQGQQLPVQLGVWGVRLIAERVGSAVYQPTLP